VLTAVLPLAGFACLQAIRRETAGTCQATSLFTETTLEAAHTFRRFNSFGSDIDIGRRQCHRHIDIGNGANSAGAMTSPRSSLERTNFEGFSLDA